MMYMQCIFLYIFVYSCITSTIVEELQLFVYMLSMWQISKKGQNYDICICNVYFCIFLYIFVYSCITSTIVEELQLFVYMLSMWQISKKGHLLP
jgi:hypothetical protein